jgi:hypothetical protein
MNFDDSEWRFVNPKDGGTAIISVATIAFCGALAKTDAVFQRPIL